MPFLQLSTLPLPGSAHSQSVFPFLHQEGTPARYRMTVLVSQFNAAAIAVLKLWNFGPKAGQSSLGADWVFYTCPDAGPFRSLTDDATAAPVEQLATYLTFVFPDGQQGDVRKPDTLTVLQQV